jgi:hypothetical protein
MVVFDPHKWPMQDFNEQPLLSAKLVDRYARYLESPVQRLKFLDGLRKIQTEDTGFLRRMALWLPVLGSMRQRALIAIEVAKLMPPTRKVPLNFRVLFVLYRLRLALYAASLIGIMSLGAGAVYCVARLAGSLPVLSQTEGESASGAAAGPARQTDSAGPLKDVQTRAQLPLDKVWLAERGDGYEFYSNGARVLTGFETTGDERRFYRFHFSDGNLESTASTSPVGIVFHVSQSDKLPFSGQFNSSLNNVSKALLEYARAHRLYNYIIDRFGRIYRIVRDEDVSNHAGNSVWGGRDDFYVNLSASFIGICLEGKYTPGKAVGPEEINEPQIYAARILTAVLRSKYGIEDRNCVTHGLVSVNPSNHLLGYHTDWVSGFPFEALGLSNKNGAELIAVSEFGFRYDEAYVLAAGGNKWAGLESSDVKLRELAASDGTTLERMREIRWRVFQQAYDLERHLDLEREARSKQQEESRGS